MNKSDFIRLSGWSLIFGAVVFYSFFLLSYLNDNGYNVARVMPGWGISYDASVYWSLFPLAIGMFGLRARYGEQVGKLGKTILLISPLGIFISYYGLTQASIYEQNALILGAGHLILQICLTLFGILVLIKKPLPRWNAVPLVAGMWLPVFLISMFLSGEQPTGVPLSMVLMFTIQLIAMLMLGYILQADVPQKQVPSHQEQTA